MKLTLVMLLAMLSSLSFADSKCGDYKSARKAIKEKVRQETGIENASVLISALADESEESLTFISFDPNGPELRSGGVVGQFIVNKKDCSIQETILASMTSLNK